MILGSQAYHLSSDNCYIILVPCTPFSIYISQTQQRLLRKMENQPMTGGRRWFRLGSVAQLNAPVQGPTPAPTQGPAPSSAPPAQAIAPRIPLSGLPSERAPALPQPQPPPPQTQQTQANNIVNGTRASQQQTPPSPNHRAPAQPQPPPSPRPRTPSQPPPPPSPRSTIMARPLTPQPPESPNPRTRAPTPTSESPITRILSPPPESPKVIKTLTPPESPINRQLQPIRSPPPYPEPEPNPKPTTNHKTAFMQQGSSNGSVKTIADINGKQHVNSNQSHIDARSPPPPPSPRRETIINGEKKFITMAGENMGAYMELGSPNGQHINRKQHHGYYLQHQNKGIEPESEREPTNKKKDREEMSVTEGKPTVALVNSNVQSVNNSIIFRSSCTQQSPGVHETIISRRQPKHKGTIHQ